MGAISVDSQGHAAQEGRLSPKAVARALILLAALLAAALGVYWLASAPGESRRAPAAAATSAPPAQSRDAAASAAAEPLLKAPAATCVDGRPASAAIPAEACR